MMSTSARALHRATVMKADGELACELGKAMRELLSDAEKQCRKAAKTGKVKPVHHARTALRRVEVAVDVAAQLDLTKVKKAARLRDSLHAIEKCLGDTRDDDVLAKAFDAKALPELAQHLSAHRAKAAREMQKALRKTRTKRVFARVGKLAKRGLRGPRADLESARQKPVLVRHRVAEVLARGLSGIIAYDQRVPADVDDEVIHKVRGAARALRFAIEMFAGALPKKAARVAAEIHALQSRLGTLHDHVFALARVGDLLDDEALAPTPALNAWLDEQASERARLHAGFAREWRALSGSFRPRLLALTTES